MQSVSTVITQTKLQNSRRYDRAHAFAVLKYNCDNAEQCDNAKLKIDDL